MKYFLVIIFTLSAVVYAQEQISVHQRDKLKYGKEKNFSGSLTNSGQKIIPLRKISDTYLSKSVFGFLPYWEYP